MLSQLVILFALARNAFATTYYVESSPVAPFLCTITQPCRLSDLPGAFTVTDEIIFVPATTGTSSTFSFPSKLYTNPSIVLSPGVILSNSALTIRSSPLFNCSSASMVSGSQIKTITVADVESTGCNFTNAQLGVTGSNTVNFVNSYVRGMTGTQRFLFSGVDVTVDTVSFTSCTSAQVILTVATGSDDSTFVVQNIIYDTVTTTGGSSTMLVQSNVGIDFDLTVSEISYNAVVSDSSLMEFQVNPINGGGTFYQEIDIISVIAVGGSAKKGFMYCENNDESGQMTANVALCSATGVNFKNGAAFVLNANSGLITFNANDMHNNNICAPTNQPYLAACQGTVANTAFLFSGNDEGSHALNNCPVSFVSAGTVCP
jgi:hypothetical protein